MYHFAEILKLANHFECLAEKKGPIYLIHFHKQIGSDNPRGKALHYIGWSENLFNRLDQHAIGQGSAIVNYHQHEADSLHLISFSDTDAFG